VVTPPLPPEIAPFHDAQQRAIAMLGDVLRRVQAGMSEADIAEMAASRLQDHGFDGWYHRPEVATGAALASPSPFARVSSRRKAEVGDMVAVDIGPAAGDAYGDVGATIVVGGGAEPEALAGARAAVRACCSYASRWKTCGEVFIFGQSWAVNHRLELANKNAVGHRVLRKEGLLATGWPRSAHLATYVNRNRLYKLNPVRMDGMFAVRPHITVAGTGATFEEMIYIHEDTRCVLGRGSYEEIGTF
jgi:Xaa-Pro aminopeptidase